MPSEIPKPGEGDGEHLTVAETLAEQVAVLCLAGELDHDTAPILRDALRRCEETGSKRVLVDLSELGFCDSTGLNLLLEARLRAQERGALVALVGMPAPVARLFKTTGAGTLFPQYASLADAQVDGG
ncbi:STAS domain-containing protein [Streptacidiphilus melanogenes]|uniref:STAS domain-containing protein n=1 Tax=Streptacidiphilus melanogenes TaxID=411235 RepID=UPI0006938077|nr:STAS domain-containing protein [Streptacidiphilus melanogenes]